MKALSTIAASAAECVKYHWARLMCFGLLFAAGATSAQSEFVDRLKNAQAIDSTALRQRANTTVNDWGFIIQIAAMLLGLVFVIWGIIWVMNASRSEGRKEAKAGWIMIIGGGGLGAIMAIYMLFVGGATALAGQN